MSGRWRPDFAAVEPDPVPTATIGWLTWQIIWWWESTFRAVEGKPLLSPDEVDWPGDAASVKKQFELLGNRWEKFLKTLEASTLEKKISHLWPEPTPLWQSIAWVNSELMKNAAEIGYIRFLYGSRSADRQSVASTS